ncbi:MAG: hypothetical protein RJB14_1767 [Pseudomonadota bacterium]|jgi:hypothetical protein
MSALSEPGFKLAYEAVVDIAPRQDLGASPLGERFIVPILGGHFEGERLSGRVLPGGADRQLLRPDGVKELDALYEMRTDDGCVITVRNRVLIDEQAEGGRYARSVVRLQASHPRYEWLQKRVFVGTLESLRPERSAVKIRVFELI